MKKKYYQTEGFKKLHAEWNKKLEGSGIEVECLDEEYLVKPQIFKTGKVQSHGGLDYYEFCQQILREFDFGEGFHSEIRRLIFELHTEGQSERQIAIHLRENANKSLSNVRVHQIINEIKVNFLRAVKNEDT